MPGSSGMATVGAVVDVEGADVCVLVCCALLGPVVLGSVVLGAALVVGVAVAVGTVVCVEGVVLVARVLLVALVVESAVVESASSSGTGGAEVVVSEAVVCSLGEVTVVAGGNSLEVGSASAIPRMASVGPVAASGSSMPPPPSGPSFTHVSRWSVSVKVPVHTLAGHFS